jgi:hypothetical protein
MVVEGVDGWVDTDYYFNESTGESVFEEPWDYSVFMKEKAEHEVDMPTCLWERLEAVGDTGVVSTYYYNAETGQSSYVTPLDYKKYKSDLAEWKRNRKVKRKRFVDFNKYKQKAMAVDDKLKEKHRKEADDRKQKVRDDALAEKERRAKKRATIARVEGDKLTKERQKVQLKAARGVRKTEVAKQKADQEQRLEKFKAEMEVKMTKVKEEMAVGGLNHMISESYFNQHKMNNELNPPEWIESFDPTHKRHYYYNMRTHESSWVKPKDFVMAADDETMRATIKLQCAWRSKVAYRLASTALERKMKDIAFKMRQTMGGGMLDEVNAKLAKYSQQGNDCPWVATWDPVHARHYYYHKETKMTSWVRPHDYIMAADDLLMKTVIKIQCVWRGRRERKRKRNQKWDAAMADEEADLELDASVAKAAEEHAEKMEEVLKKGARWKVFFKEMLPPKILEVEVLSAQNLAKADSSWNPFKKPLKSDPYVKVEFHQLPIPGGQKMPTIKMGQTAVVKQNLNPKWENERMEAKIFEHFGPIENASVQLQVFDSDKVGDDEFLGETIVPGAVWGAAGRIGLPALELSRRLMPKEGEVKKKRLRFVQGMLQFTLRLVDAPEGKQKFREYYCMEKWDAEKEVWVLTENSTYMKPAGYVMDATPEAIRCVVTIQTNYRGRLARRAVRKERNEKNEKMADGEDKFLLMQEERRDSRFEYDEDYLGKLARDQQEEVVKVQMDFNRMLVPCEKYKSETKLRNVRLAGYLAPPHSIHFPDLYLEIVKVKQRQDQKGLHQRSTKMLSSLTNESHASIHYMRGFLDNEMQVPPDTGNMLMKAQEAWGNRMTLKREKSKLANVMMALGERNTGGLDKFYKNKMQEVMHHRLLQHLLFKKQNKKHIADVDPNYLSYVKMHTPASQAFRFKKKGVKSDGTDDIKTAAEEEQDYAAMVKALRKEITLERSVRNSRRPQVEEDSVYAGYMERLTEVQTNEGPKDRNLRGWDRRASVEKSNVKMHRETKEAIRAQSSKNLMMGNVRKAAKHGAKEKKRKEHATHHRTLETFKEKKDCSAKIDIHIEKLKTAEGATPWVECYDPKNDTVYYFNKDTKESAWEKPLHYTVAADDELMSAVIKIQCMWRKRCAQQKFLAQRQFKEQLQKKDRYHSQLDSANKSLRKMSKRMLHKMDSSATRALEEEEDEMLKAVLKLQACWRRRVAHRRLHYQNKVKNMRSFLVTTTMVDTAARDVAAQKKKLELFRTQFEFVKHENLIRNGSIWSQPSMEKAMEHRMRVVYGGGKCNVLQTTPESMGSQMGVGVTLYFRFLGLMTQFFFKAFILALPLLLFNMMGKGITLEEADPLGFCYTTSGNLGTREGNMKKSYCDKHPDVCDGTAADVMGLFEIDSMIVSYLYTLLDLVFSVMYMRTCIEFKKMIDVEVKDADVRTCSAADYAIFVTGFPVATTEADIRRHFNERYTMHKQRHQMEWKFSCFGKRTVKLAKNLERMQKLHPVQNLEHVEMDDEYTQSWVAEVVIGRPIGDMIRTFKHNELLLKQIRLANLMVKKYQKDTTYLDGEGASETMERRARKKVKSLENKSGRLVKEMQVKFKRYGKSHCERSPVQECVCAYVIFENEESKACCIEDYSTSTNWFGNFFQPKELRYQELKANGARGRLMPLCVREAPEPNDVIWENLEDIGMAHFIRKVISWTITILFLVGSFAMVFYAQLQSSKVALALGDTKVCPQLPAMYFGHYDWESVTEDALPPDVHLDLNLSRPIKGKPGVGTTMICPPDRPFYFSYAGLPKPVRASEAAYMVRLGLTPYTVDSYVAPFNLTNSTNSTNATYATFFNSSNASFVEQYNYYGADTWVNVHSNLTEVRGESFDDNPFDGYMVWMPQITYPQDGPDANGNNLYPAFDEVRDFFPFGRNATMRSRTYAQAYAESNAWDGVNESAKRTKMAPLARMRPGICPYDYDFDPVAFYSTGYDEAVGCEPVDLCFFEESKLVPFTHFTNDTNTTDAHFTNGTNTTGENTTRRGRRLLALDMSESMSPYRIAEPPYTGVRCEDNFAFVQTAADCLQASTEVGWEIVDFSSTSPDPNKPAGCYLNTNTQKLYFNPTAVPSATQSTDIKRISVCKSWLEPTKFPTAFPTGYPTLVNETGMYGPDYPAPKYLGPSGFGWVEASKLCRAGTGVDTSHEQAKCGTLACGVEDWRRGKFGNGKCQAHKPSLMVSCYCVEEVSRQVSALGLFAGMTFVKDQDPVCGKYVDNLLFGQLMMIAAAVVVVVINVGVTVIMTMLSDFERHISRSEYGTGLVLKIFISQFMNTAMITLLVNAKLPAHIMAKVPFGRDLQGLGVMDGQYEDFERGWYATVGTALCVTMCVNIIAPQAMPLMKKQARVLYAWYRTSFTTISTQEELNELQEGPPFLIEDRYPAFLNTLFVTLLFSAGMPVLLPFAGLSFMICYMMDKMLLLRLYLKPYFDEKVALLTARLMPIPLLAHLMFSFWMFGSNEGMFPAHTFDIRWFLSSSSPSGDDDDERKKFELWYEDKLEDIYDMDPLGEYGFIPKIMRLNVLPLFLFVVFTLVYFIMKNSVYTWIKNLLQYSTQFLTCGNYGAYIPEQAEPENIPPYTGKFRMLIARTLAHDLSDAEMKLGWRSKLSGGRIELSRIHRRKGEHGEGELKFKHREGELMLTWQAMATLSSYQIQRHQHYRTAINFARDNIRGEPTKFEPMGGLIACTDEDRRVRIANKAQKEDSASIALAFQHPWAPVNANKIAIEKHKAALMAPPPPPIEQHPNNKPMLFYIKEEEKKEKHERLNMERQEHLMRQYLKALADKEERKKAGGAADARRKNRELVEQWSKQNGDFWAAMAKLETDKREAWAEEEEFQFEEQEIKRKETKQKRQEARNLRSLASVAKRGNKEDTKKKEKRTKGKKKLGKCDLTGLPVFQWTEHVAKRPGQDGKYNTAVYYRLDQWQYLLKSTYQAILALKMMQRTFEKTKLMAKKLLVPQLKQMRERVSAEIHEEDLQRDKIERMQERRGMHWEDMSSRLVQTVENTTRNIMRQAELMDAAHASIRRSSATATPVASTTPGEESTPLARRNSMEVLEEEDQQIIEDMASKSAMRAMRVGAILSGRTAWVEEQAAEARVAMEKKVLKRGAKDELLIKENGEDGEDDEDGEATALSKATEARDEAEAHARKVIRHESKIMRARYGRLHDAGKADVTPAKLPRIMRQRHQNNIRSMLRNVEHGIRKSTIGRRALHAVEALDRKQPEPSHKQNEEIERVLIHRSKFVELDDDISSEKEVLAKMLETREERKAAHEAARVERHRIQMEEILQARREKAEEREREAGENHLMNMEEEGQRYKKREGARLKAIRDQGVLHTNLKWRSKLKNHIKTVEDQRVIEEQELKRRQLEEAEQKAADMRAASGKNEELSAMRAKELGTLQQQLKADFLSFGGGYSTKQRQKITQLREAAERQERESEAVERTVVETERRQVAVVALEAKRTEVGELQTKVEAAKSAGVVEKVALEGKRKEVGELQTKVEAAKAAGAPPEEVAALEEELQAKSSELETAEEAEVTRSEEVKVLEEELQTKSSALKTAEVAELATVEAFEKEDLVQNEHLDHETKEAVKRKVDEQIRRHEMNADLQQRQEEAAELHAKVEEVAHKETERRQVAEVVLDGKRTEVGELQTKVEAAKSAGAVEKAALEGKRKEVGELQTKVEAAKAAGAPPEEVAALEEELQAKSSELKTAEQAEVTRSEEVKVLEEELQTKSSALKTAEEVEVVAQQEAAVKVEKATAQATVAAANVQKLEEIETRTELAFDEGEKKRASGWGRLRTGIKAVGLKGMRWERPAEAESMEAQLLEELGMGMEMDGEQGANGGWGAIGKHKAALGGKNAFGVGGNGNLSASGLLSSLMDSGEATGGGWGALNKHKMAMGGMGGNTSDFLADDYEREESERLEKEAAVAQHDLMAAMLSGQSGERYWGKLQGKQSSNAALTSFGLKMKSKGDGMDMSISAMLREAAAGIGGAEAEGESQMDPEEMLQLVTRGEEAVIGMTLNKSISDIPPGSRAEADFTAGFTTDLATALGLLPSQVLVRSIVAGSVIVHFAIVSSKEPGAGPVGNAAELFKQQLSSGTGPIFQGTVTFCTDASRGFQVEYHTPPPAQVAMLKNMKSMMMASKLKGGKGAMSEENADVMGSFLLQAQMHKITGGTKGKFTKKLLAGQKKAKSLRGQAEEAQAEEDALTALRLMQEAGEEEERVTLGAQQLIQLERVRRAKAGMKLMKLKTEAFDKKFEAAEAAAAAEKAEVEAEAWARIEAAEKSRSEWDEAEKAEVEREKEVASQAKLVVRLGYAKLVHVQRGREEAQAVVTGLESKLKAEQTEKSRILQEKSEDSADRLEQEVVLDKQRERARKLNEKAVMMKARGALEDEVEAMFKKAREAEEVLAGMVEADEVKAKEFGEREAARNKALTKLQGTIAELDKDLDGAREIAQSHVDEEARQLRALAEMEASQRVTRAKNMLRGFMFRRKLKVLSAAASADADLMLRLRAEQEADESKTRQNLAIARRNLQTLEKQDNARRKEATAMHSSAKMRASDAEAKLKKLRADLEHAEMRTALLREEEGSLQDEADELEREHQERRDEVTLKGEALKEEVKQLRAAAHKAASDATAVDDHQSVFGKQKVREAIAAKKALAVAERELAEFIAEVAELEEELQEEKADLLEGIKALADDRIKAEVEQEALSTAQASAETEDTAAREDLQALEKAQSRLDKLADAKLIEMRGKQTELDSEMAELMLGATERRRLKAARLRTKAETAEVELSNATEALEKNSLDEERLEKEAAEAQKAALDRIQGLRKKRTDAQTMMVNAAQAGRDAKDTQLEAAAFRVQGVWRNRIVRRRLRDMVYEVYIKYWDEELGAWVYFNKNTKQYSEKKPVFLGEDEDIEAEEVKNKSDERKRLQEMDERKKREAEEAKKQQILAGQRARQEEAEAEAAERALEAAQASSINDLEDELKKMEEKRRAAATDKVAQQAWEDEYNRKQAVLQAAEKKAKHQALEQQIRRKKHAIKQQNRARLDQWVAEAEDLVREVQEDNAQKEAEDRILQFKEQARVRLQQSQLADTPLPLAVAPLLEVAEEVADGDLDLFALGQELEKMEQERKARHSRDERRTVVPVPPSFAPPPLDVPPPPSYAPPPHTAPGDFAAGFAAGLTAHQQITPTSTALVPVTNPTIDAWANPRPSAATVSVGGEGEGEGEGSQLAFAPPREVSRTQQLKVVRMDYSPMVTKMVVRNTKPRGKVTTGKKRTGLSATSQLARGAKFTLSKSMKLKPKLKPRRVLKQSGSAFIRPNPLRLKRTEPAGVKAGFVLTAGAEIRQDAKYSKTSSY